MSSPAASTDTSTLSPPPEHLSPPSSPSLSTLSSIDSPSPFPSPPPKSIARGKPKSSTKTTSTKTKSTKKQETGHKITLKLKQPINQDLTKEKKKVVPKPREPKIEAIPRTLVNNHDVPLIVLFRSKFRVLFSGTAELGPQDVEEGVNVEGDVSGKLEEFILRICTLIGNRRKNVERENLGKVLQETVDFSFEKFGFRREGVNMSPLSNTTFATLDWDGRLHLLRALVHWALLSSEAVRQIIDDGYKLGPNSRIERSDLDVSTGLGVIPLATIKGDNYYLVEGRDTRFRIYHETNPHHKIINISSIAEDKPSLISLAERLGQGNKQEQELAGTIRDTLIARIEAAEQRRVKAEQAALRLAMWKASAPVYNTRTRGKKVDYTEFEKSEGEDDDDEGSGTGGRRSERNRGEREVVEYSASGRMIKRPRTGDGEIRESRMKDLEESEEEMEWSVYSDKGETDGDDVDDAMVDEEEDEYDLDRRSLVVNLKLQREVLKKVLQESAPVNGQKTPAPKSPVQTQPPQSPQFSPKAHPQPKMPAFQHSPPRALPPSIPYRSPTQIQGPLPYTGGASPPISTRQVQLSPQPIPRPLPYSPTQSFPQSIPYQTSPRAYQQPAQTQSFRQPPYAVAQFQQTSPPPPSQVSPRPYTPTNGIHQTSPAQKASPQQSPATWSPPRPFGATTQSPGVQPYGKPPTPTVPTTNPATVSPKQTPPRSTEVSHQQTWAAATFEPNPSTNGVTSYSSPEKVVELVSKIPAHTMLEVLTSPNIGNGGKLKYGSYAKTESPVPLPQNSNGQGNGDHH